MRISESVRSSTTPDGVVLMNIKEGSMLALNPTGSVIWQLLSDGRTPVQIAARLAAEFGISHEQACADVDEFLDNLKAHQLIDPDESYDSRTMIGFKPGGLICNLFGKCSERTGQKHHPK